MYHSRLSRALALLVKTDVFQLHKATTVPTVAVPNSSLWILLLVSIVSLNSYRIINMHMDMYMYILRGHAYCIGRLAIYTGGAAFGSSKLCFN